MGDVDFLADAVALAGQQRGNYAESDHDRAALIGDPAGDVGRRLVGSADRVHDSGAPLSQVVEGRIAALGSLGAVARRARIDEARIVRAERLVVEPEPRGDTLAEVLHEHVALGRQLADDLARFGLLQVEREALLVAVVGLEVEIARGLVGRAAGHRENPSRRVAALALLDLDYLGAQVRQHHACNRTLLPDGPIDDPNSLERSVHVVIPARDWISEPYIAQDSARE